MNKFFLILFFVFLSLSYLVGFSIKKPDLKISKQDSALNLKPELLVKLAAGNNRLLSSLMWISTLLESDLEHYGNRDLGSWLYLRFLTISILEPKFLLNYQFGGKYLMIVKDDLAGAEQILLKGLEKFQTDEKLLTDVGFLYTFELRNYSEGLKHYERLLASSAKVPDVLKSLVIKLRLQTSETDLEIAFDSVKHLYEQTENEFLRKKLWANLYAIKSEIDLDCLNSLEVKYCDPKDLNGDLYIKKGETYISPKPFKPYKLYMKK